MKVKIIILAVCAVFVISSCTKEDITASDVQPSSTGSYAKVTTTRTYQESFIATSTITPTNTGIYNPGSGHGSATQFGFANTYFNQFVNFIIINGVPTPTGSSAAPVNQFYATQLASAGINNIPNTVSTITYDFLGNSVWFTSSSGTSLSPVSATRVNFTAALQIIGGTGKFAGATGSVTMNGYFNPQSATQAATIQTAGTITY